MRVPLPSGGEAEFRDVIQRGDIRKARKGMVFIINADGSRQQDGSFIDELTGRMITAMMTAWPHGTLPSQAQTEEHAQRILDGLPDDEYDALAAAVGPWVERVLKQRGSAKVFTHVSGIRVEPATDADEAKMNESADWTREDEADPKPASTGTGISSSASPERDGPPKTDQTPSISS